MNCRIAYVLAGERFCEELFVVPLPVVGLILERGRGETRSRNENMFVDVDN